MSSGLMCLGCRKYIGNYEWPCKCEYPIPSVDAKTPATSEQIDYELSRDPPK